MLPISERFHNGLWASLGVRIQVWGLLDPPMTTQRGVPRLTGELVEALEMGRDSNQRANPGDELGVGP